jgi:hypothetical protein
MELMLTKAPPHKSKLQHPNSLLQHPNKKDIPEILPKLMTYLDRTLQAKVTS